MRTGRNEQVDGGVVANQGAGGGNLTGNLTGGNLRIGSHRGGTDVGQTGGEQDFAGVLDGLADHVRDGAFLRLGEARRDDQVDGGSSGCNGAGGGLGADDIADQSAGIRLGQGLADDEAGVLQVGFGNGFQLAADIRHGGDAGGAEREGHVDQSASEHFGPRCRTLVNHVADRSRVVVLSAGFANPQTGPANGAACSGLVQTNDVGNFNIAFRRRRRRFTG